MNAKIFKILLLIGFIASIINSFSLYKIVPFEGIFNASSAFFYLLVYGLYSKEKISYEWGLYSGQAIVFIQVLIMATVMPIESSFFIWLFIYPLIAFIFIKRTPALIGSLALYLLLLILFSLSYTHTSINSANLLNIIVFYFVFTLISYLVNFNFDTNNQTHKVTTKHLQDEVEKATQHLHENNKQLKESLDNFKNLFNVAMEMMVLFDKNRNIIDINISGAQMLGFKDPQELTGKNLSEFLTPSGIQEVIKQTRKSFALPYEVTLVKKDGTIFPTQVAGKDVPYNGEIVRMSTIVDLTLIKEKEHDMVIQSRHAHMGEMINMIAHQWRQPLTAINATTSLIRITQMTNKYDLETTKEREEFLDFLNDRHDNIEASVTFLSETINDFRNFLKVDKEKIRTSLNTPIDLALNLVRTPMENENNITITTDYKAKEYVAILKNELTQVILNILKNAEENFIQTRTENPTIHIQTLHEENFIIRISDNGGGIDPKIIHKIFDPYFSTKHARNGTGLGMYMSQKIVHEHMNGQLKVSNTNEGACFEILFECEDGL